LQVRRFAGHRICAQGRFTETSLSFNTPASLQATEAKIGKVEAVLRGDSQLRYTLTTINTGTAPGRHVRQHMCA
jgi:HAE1 family hydrophobic/amphiphilic exporter-1